METEEITKLVDGIYKNILEKFNPGARQLINAGKTYLKALHGAAAASKLYVEAINKLARQAQQGTWGGSADIGSALLQIVEVYKEIQNQQMNILKAFYVDLLVPLETNLEKDTKVVQCEQKRFMQQHKQRSETYSKAAATMKKQRKKNKGTTKTGLAMDKEVKNMQILEEERTKLDAFCEQSLKTAMTQERRRYGFVLERQCSLAKHYLAYHSQGSTALQRHLDEWQEVAQTREYLPDNVDSIFTNRLRQVSFWPDEDVYSSPRSPNVEDDRLSIASQLRKTKSMDASCLDVRSINDVTSPLKPLSRAKSEFNLTASTHSLVQDQDTLKRPKSIAVERGGWDSQLARALYAYLSSGDNQLSFLEGDIIALMGERNKGWQFGENLRTQCSGWFPLAYTEMLIDDQPGSSPTHQRGQSYDSGGSAGSDRTTTTPATPPSGLQSNFSMSAASPSQSASVTSPGGRQGKTVTAVIETVRTSGVTMFGDTLTHRPAPKQMGGRGRVSVGPPPLVPAPVPTPKVPSLTLPVTQRRLIQPPPMPPLPTLLTNATKRAPGVIGNVGNASLHSSNDSGFSNDPPPAPEVDYSDDDSARKTKAHRPRKTKKLTADDVTKSRLLSSVRGWLLYKSALDLWDDVNNQENSPDNQQTLPRHAVVRQSSSVGHLASLGRSHEELATPETQAKKHEPLSEKKSLDATTAGLKVKRSKSIWRFRKNDVDMGVVEGMALWQHRSLVDIHAALENEPAPKKEDNSNKKNSKGTPIMKTKLVALKYGDDNNDKKELKEKYRKKSSPILDRKDKENFLNKSKDDLDYEEVPSPEMSIKKLKAKLKRTDTDDDDDGLVTRHKISESSFDYDTDISLQGDSESCIVVNDHLRAATLKNNRNKGENGTLLPRTKLMMKYSLTLGSKNKSKSRETLNIGDGEGLLFYGRTLEKRLSKPERGSRFDQMSTTPGNMCGPWYDLWGVDASVNKK